MNQRARSSAAWFKRVAVCGLRTPSRGTRDASDAAGTAVLSWPRAAVTKFTRSTTVLDEIHDSLLGQPPTSGGSKSDWPLPEPAAMTIFEGLVKPRASAAWTMNSVGLLTRVL